MRNNGQWVRVGIEGLVIVGSILLAFGIDAAWDTRSDMVRRDALREGLRRDFASTSVELQRVSEGHTASRLAVAHLMAMRDSTLSSSAGPRVDALVTETLGGGSFDPPQGTLTALLSRGELDLVATPELAEVLTRWPAEVDNLRGREEAVGRTIRLLADYLIAEGYDLSDFAWGDASTPYQGLAWTPRHTEAFSLAAVPEFRSHLGFLWFYYRNTTDAQSDLRSSLAEIQRLLRE